MINLEDNFSVGESVKLRGRWIAEEQRRKAVEKIKLLKEEEIRIAKMKTKLDRRKRKEERRKKDRERMDRGNRELMSREMFSGEKSFLAAPPVNSSTQKTVVFDEELTKIRSISPVESNESLIGLYYENSDSDEARMSIKDTKPFSDKREVKQVIPSSLGSQQVFLPTQPLPKCKRKVKSIKNGRRIPFRRTTSEIFDSKLGVQCLLGSEKLTPCEFSLPKEYTSLKLEKIRENNILSQSLIDNSLKRKRDSSDSDEQQSPKRKVRSCHFVRKRLEKSPFKQSKHITLDPAIGLVEVELAIFEKCVEGNYSVVVCISNADISVWVRSHLDAEVLWSKVGQFSIQRKPCSPFLIVDKDTIRIKSFCVERNQLKECSYVILGDNGDFSDAVTSVQNVLVFTESVKIDDVVVEKFDGQRVIVFHNLDKFTRGSLFSFSEAQTVITFLTTLEGYTNTVKILIGTNHIFLSFMFNIIHFWDVNCGVCVTKIALNEVDFDSYIILNTILVKGMINILHVIGEKLKISVLRKNNFLSDLATISLPKHLRMLETNPSTLLYINKEVLNLQLDNLCLEWNLSDKTLKCNSIGSVSDFKFLLPF